MDKLFILIYSLVALIIIFYIYKSYKQNSKLGYLMNRMLIFALIIVLGYCLNLISNNHLVMSFGNSLVFAAISFMLLSLLCYTLEFVNRKPNKIFILICFIYAAAEGIFLITNPFHELALTYTEVNFYGNIILNYIPKLPFYIHLLFSYFLIALTIIELIIKQLKVPKAYKIRYNMLLCSLLFAVIINFLFLTDKINLVIDLSIITYGLIVCIMYIFTFQYNPWIFVYETQKMVMMNIENPIILFDYENVITQFNNAFNCVFDLNEAEKVSMTVTEFLSKSNIAINDLSASQTLECSMSRNENVAYYECKYLCINDNKGKKIGILITFNNITELKKANNKLEDIAFYDQLTGLYNKYAFDNVIEKWNNADMFPIGVAVLNINNLKFINNFFGIQNGDKVIECLASAIKNACKDNYFSARLYGEDFVMIMPNSDEKISIGVMEKICNEFDNVKHLGFNINVEFGVAIKNSYAANIIDIISIARESMNNKKILSENSQKSSLLDSLRQSLIESDFETEEHVERTNKLAIQLGKKMGLSDNDLAKLSLLAILHDIGKISTPSYILLKPGKLTKEEWDIMKQHTTRGYRIAKSYPELSQISSFVLSHHERWDGTGYPNGLKQDEIPLLSRIISIVDSYDVMVHDRPYHKAITKDEAIEELKRCSGTQFNPEITEIFIFMLTTE